MVSDDPTAASVVGLGRSRYRYQWMVSPKRLANPQKHLPALESVARQPDIEIGRRRGVCPRSSSGLTFEPADHVLVLSLVPDTALLTVELLVGVRHRRGGGQRSENSDELSIRYLDYRCTHAPVPNRVPQSPAWSRRRIGSRHSTSNFGRLSTIFMVSRLTVTIRPMRSRM